VLLLLTMLLVKIKQHLYDLCVGRMKATMGCYLFANSSDTLMFLVMKKWSGWNLG
jgi:hypothetical protein